jgi:hypothetical protein
MNMTVKQILSIALSATFLFGLTIWSAIPAKAQGFFTQDGVGVVPTEKDPANIMTKSWFLENIKPGEKVTRSADVINSTTEQKTIMISAKDALQTGEGSYGFIPTNAKNTGAGSWITVSTDKVTLDSGRMTPVKFDISVPSDAKPGEYSAVIAVQTAPAETGAAIKFTSRVGARIYITVPGELKTGIGVSRFEFINPKSPDYNTYTLATIKEPHDSLYLVLDAKNIGNIYTKMKGTVEVTTPTETFKLPDLDRDLAPLDTTVTIRLNTQKTWQVGTYKAKFMLETAPVIASNKKDIKDTSPTKMVETSFTMTQEILDQMKKDKEDKAGTKLKAEQEAKTNSSNFQITSQNAEASKEDKKKDTMMYWYIGGGVLFVLLLGIIGFLVYKLNKKDKGEEKKPESSNDMEQPATSEKKASKKKK